jgi:hypothetical protein
MNTGTQDDPSSTLRISDADRDRAIAELSEHFQAGRLTAGELEDRTGQALRARTAADLAALFTDLPRQHPAPASPAPAPAPAGSHLPARVPVVPIVIIAAVVLSGLLSGHPGLIALVPVLALIIVRRLTGAGRRRRIPADRRRPYSP